MALQKTLWQSIVDLVSTGQNVSDQLDTAFTNIDDAITQVDANTNALSVLTPLNNFSTVQIVNHTVAGTTYEPVASFNATKDAGSYLVLQSMIYSLDSITTSAFFRFSVDGGTTWTEVRREPKDNTDKEPLSNAFMLTHAGGILDIQIEARKEAIGDVLEIFSLDLIIERKA